MSKTRMGKRVASLLLSLVMMLSLLPTTVYATEDTGGGTGATYDAVQQTESGDDTENTGELESTGEGGSEAGNKAETYVAQVDGTQYATLEEAVKAAENGKTVSLLDNVTLNTTLTVAKSITIDVGGFTLTVATDGDGIVVNNATLTLTGTGKYVFNCTASGSDGIFVNNTDANTTSNLNLSGNVKIRVSNNSNSVIHAYAATGNASVNISGGALTVDGTGSKFSAVVIDQNAALNMNGGEIDLSVDFESYSKSYNDVVGVLLWGQNGKQENCTANINGGAIKVGGKNAFAQAVQVGMKNGYSENCMVNISGGEVVLNQTGSGEGYVYAPYNDAYATATITGGTVSGNVTALTVTNLGEDTATLTITGGTFSGITVDEKYLAEGKTLDESGNVVDKAPEVKPVTVNGVGYDTLAAAIAAAESGATVKLLADVDENVEIAAGKNLTLDLNDCTLNGGTGTNKAALTNYGTITITDSSEAKTGTIKRDDIGTVGETSYYVILNQGTMTIESGTVINNSGYKKANSTGSMVGSSLICNGDCNGGSTLTINGGTFTQYNFIAIKNGALGVLNVTGGMITSNHSAIQNWFEADITGGEINGQLWTDAYTAGGSNGKTKIGGNATFTGEIVMDIYGNSVAPKLEITGGKLNVTNWRITGAAAAVGAKPAVSGGTFTAEVPADYLADGFEIKQNSDGSYGVEKAASYVAKIDEQSYATLQAAFDAANAGDTITLLADTTEDVTINKNITLDLGGKTLTNTNAGKATISVTGGTVTVKSGNVMGGTSYYNIEVTKGSNANLTLEDVTATAGNTDSSMIDNWGTLTIKSGTYTGGLNVVKSEEGSTLTINGGTFTLDYATNGYTGVVFAYGDTTISGGEFIQNLTTTGRWNHPTVILTGVVEGYTAITRVTGGHFVNKMSGESIFRGAGKGTSDNFEVSGGTFNKSVPDSFFKEGYFAQKNTDGTYGVGGPAVAKVNSAEGYNTLAEAIAAAKAGETVTLLQNVTVDKPIIVGKAITLDLGGKTLTSTWAMPSDASGADRYALVNNAKMTLTNGTFAAGEARAIGAYAGLTLNNVIVSQTLTGGHACVAFCKDGATYTIKDSTINGAYAVANFANNATIKITGSELNGSGCGLYHNGSNYGLKLTVRATTINGSLDGAIGNENDPSGVYISGSTATVEKGGMQFASFTNCTIKGATAIEVKYTNLTLDKCTVEATAKTPSYSKNNNGMTALGFAVVSTDNSKDGVTPVPAGTVTITGKGNYTGLVGLGALKSVKETYKDFADGTIKVSGGTFSSAVKEEYCADGYIPTANGDGTYGVKEGQYVAYVGTSTNKFETLQAAINAAKDSQTVRLLADITLTETAVFPAGKKVSINLQGHKITATGTALRINGTTEINSSKTGAPDAAQTGMIVSTNNVAVAVGNNAKLSVFSGTLKGREGAVITGTSTGATIDVRGSKATLIATDNAVIAGNGSKRDGDPNNITIRNGTFIGSITTPGYIACGIYAPWNDNVTVSGGTFNITNGAGIVARAGTVKVTSGTFNCTGDGTGWVGDSKNTVPCAALVFDKAANYPALTDASQILVSGGSFSTDPAANGATLAAGYVATKDESGMYKVAKADPVAEIDGVKYDTLSQAIAALEDKGGTIKLLQDINAPSMNYKITENITIDLNGHNITGSGAEGVFYVYTSGHLTITGDGVITAVENNKAAIAVQVFSEKAKVTLEGGTYKQQITNKDDPHFDLIYVYYGTAEIKGGTYEGFTPAWTLNCRDDSYKAGTAHITVTGGTFVGFDPANNTAEGEGTSFVPDGYVPKANGDGSYTVVKGTYVAEYNGNKYTSLQEAINAASQKNGGQAVVTLLGNLTITETVNFAKQYGGSVLLNLGGYTLTGENCRALQINKGNLYLENGTVTSTGIADSKSVIRIGSDDTTYSGSNPMLYMRNGAKVLAPVSYGVTIFGSATVSETLTVAGNASIEATGPSPAISGQGGQAYHVDGKGTKVIITGNAVVSATNNYAIYHPDNGTLDIQGGTITGKGGIQMCSGTLNISGSPKIEALGKANHETGASGPIYDIAAISVVNRSYPGGAPVVTIKGTPTVTANEGEVIHAYTWSSNAESEWADAGKNINVSGGTYSKTFNEAYLAAGCTLVDGENGTYTVEQKPVAEYNGTQYTSLPQAILDANNSEAGGTVKLLDNVTLTRNLGIGGSAPVTLDLDKKTLTLNGAQIYTQGSATVTINNGTIKRIDTPTSGSPNNFAIQVMSGSSLTLGATSADTVTIESTYGVYNAGGTLTVSHATITTDGWSIAVNDSASKTGVVTIGEGAVITSQNGNCISTMVNSKPNVTITGGQLTSNGTNWDAGVIYWASEGTLTITGGTFTASSVEGSTAAAVYQKNGTVKISGTTAELQGNKALVVQAGDGSTGTMITELSGGTYSTKPEDTWVVDGYRAIDNTDGSYTVEEGKFTVQVTSRTVSSDTPVANVSGGGETTYEVGTTVTAASLSGYTFKGWYLEKYTDDNSTLVKTDLSFTYKPTADCTLIAVYEPISGAKFYLTVNASEFTVGESAVYDSYMHDQVAAGESVTVTFAGKENFLYWVNASRKVVSISKEYTFIMGSETTLTAVYGKTREAQATVVFMSDSDQIITSKAYKSGTAIQFPTPPIKMGCTFTGWSMTEQKIQAAIAASNNGVIVVKACYTDPSTPYTVTVLYPDDTKEEYSGMVGKTVTLTAKEISGKIFSYWTDSENNVLGYAKTLMLAPSGSITVKAVYSDTAVEAKPVITMTAVEAGEVGTGYYVISFTATRAVPEGYTVVKQGILYSVDSQCSGEGAKDYMKLTDEGSVPAGIYVYEGNNTALSGVTRFNAKTGAVDRTIYGRGYMVLKNSSGAMEYVYSDNILSGNYSGLANIGG